MRPLPDSSEAELQAFEAVCRRLEGFAPQLGFETVDGFLTAVAAAPVAIEIDEWLPALAGADFERAFADPDDVAHARAALAARLAVLRAQLDPEALLDDPDTIRLSPTFGTLDEADRAAVLADPEVSPQALALLNEGALWSAGFLLGVTELSPYWTPPPTAVEGELELFDDLLEVVEVLAIPESEDAYKSHLERWWRDGEPDRDDLVTEACAAVQELRLWWLDHAPKPAQRVVAAQPGRNDPCPCGSGRKFKKCHGAAA